MKIIVFITIMLNTAALYAQQSDKGKIRLYLHSATCENETLDDLFEGDGKGDEIFVTVFFSVASSNGTTKYINKFTTGIYGDNRIWPARVKAGSAGSTGGIKPNDVIYLHPQTETYMPIGDERFKGLKAIEADLEAGDILTIIPVIWEWDNNSGTTQNSFESFLLNSFNNINVHMAGFTQKFDINTLNTRYGDDGSNCINISGLTQILQGVNGVPGNRPIGMALNGSYNPQVYVFNANICENWNKLLQGYSNAAWQNLPVYYNEPLSGNNRDHGKYRLMIYPEFSKTAPSNQTSPKSVNNISVIRNGDKPVKINNQTLNIISTQAITGIWAGTQTNDYGLYPQAVSFELTGNGEFIIKDQSGILASKGTYTFSNNIINGSYKQLSSGETFSFTGAFDPSTQKLNCSQGSGAATTGQGKWTVSKK